MRAGPLLLLSSFTAVYYYYCFILLWGSLVLGPSRAFPPVRQPLDLRAQQQHHSCLAATTTTTRAAGCHSFGGRGGAFSPRASSSAGAAAGSVGLTGFSGMDHRRGRRRRRRGREGAFASAPLRAAPSADRQPDDAESSQPSSSSAELSPTERILEREKLGAAERALVDAAAAKRAAAAAEDDSSAEEKRRYPVDLPSPILLATSIVLAIASTGSFFNLIGPEEPALGVAPTAAIAVIGFPLCAFLFYAAIVKAQVETEEDDKAFLSGK